MSEAIKELWFFITQDEALMKTLFVVNMGSWLAVCLLKSSYDSIRKGTK